EGGMGTVYKARHVTLNRMFAMKVLRKDLAADGALAQRFVQEAKATAAIKHAGVVAINDFGVHNGIPYFVMELLVGETLAARIRGRGPLPPRDVIGVAKRIADALDASHAAGVIHRDLKPENVFLVGKTHGKAAEDEIRIVDFGAAKVIGGSKLTRPGVVFGTPYYMSPEQASGQPVDPRADVYSLGVLMYEMITGAVPFEADTYMGVLTKHMFAEPAKPSEKIAAGIQLGELEGVVMKALEKEPSVRYASMRELGAALDDAMRKRPSLNPAGSTQRQQRTARMPDAPRVSTADAIERQVKKRVAAEEKHRKNKLVVIGVVATAGTLVAGGVAVQMFGPKPSDLPAPRPSAVINAVPAFETASSSAVTAPTESASAVASASAAPVASASASSAGIVVARTAAPSHPTVTLAVTPPKPKPAAATWKEPAWCASLGAEEKLNRAECWAPPTPKH
ncbi:MAG TPA: serine/threonine-protein kinase, partial [Labilithrix sp.]